MPNNKQQFTVPESANDQRLDVWLAEQMDISRSHAKQLIDNGAVLVDDTAPKKAGDRLRSDAIVTVRPRVVEKEIEARVEAFDPALYEQIEVMSETTDYLIVNKPAGLLVHPTDAGETQTLTAWLSKHYPEIKAVGDNPQQRPGIVHRLDKQASGLLVVARTQDAFEHLKEQFKSRQVKKQYIVLTHGTIEKDEDTIDFDIDRGTDGKMVARPYVKELSLQTIGDFQSGKHAITHFRVRERFPRYTLLDVDIETGRTHQIRVHLFAYNNPVVGDVLYYQKRYIKKNDTKLNRLFLHATSLSFTDQNGEDKRFQTALPKELDVFLDNIRV